MQLIFLQLREMLALNEADSPEKRIDPLFIYQKRDSPKLSKLHCRKDSLERSGFRSRHTI
ncbi:hypothetical protein Lal_00015176 [Lupinus albus]|nr:hypothetical protein Lal_00015176 [Lupinus albus]